MNLAIRRKQLLIKFHKFLDAWVACTDIEVETQYLLKCYNDGTFEINGKKGSGAELPDCNDKSATTTPRSRTTKPPKVRPTKAAEPEKEKTTKRVYTTPSSFKPVKPFKQLKGPKKEKGEKSKTVIGCNPSDLGPLGFIQYNASHGCKKGYDSDSNGNQKEKKNNKCVRQCTTKSGSIMKTSDPIYCACKKDNCSYQVKLKGVGKVEWNAIDSDGNPYIDISDCDEKGCVKI